MMDLFNLTADERARWNTIYGTVVAQMVLSMLGDHVEAGFDGVLPDEQVRKINTLAEVIASGSILAARGGKAE